MPKGLDHRTASDAADADDGSQLDVLILFTRAALRAEGGLRQMRASIDFAVAYANEAFAASGVDLRMLAWGDSATCSGTTPVIVGDIGDVPESSALLSMAARRESGGSQTTPTPTCSAGPRGTQPAATVCSLRPTPDWLAISGSA